MRSLATALATLMGVLYLLGRANASVIPRGTREIQGWCCSSDCSVCNDGSVHCHDGDHQTCFDLTGVSSSSTLNNFFFTQI
ncbi:hypothetical protein GE09DRAFT_1080647 [Coniochaeta sp. 2T2.1]|nr:hypothetical protein GE09DRAFT_1080647 [Coniochaeta sp. 2T2.1]